jgi:copper resistance protein B
MKRLLPILLVTTALVGCGREGNSSASAPETMPRNAPADPHSGHQSAGQGAAAADEHAGHNMASAANTPGPTAGAHSAHNMGDAAASDAHRGHSMGGMGTGDAHAGHRMSNTRLASNAHSGHTMRMPSVRTGAHTGHAMPAQAAQPDPHAGHVLTEQPPQSEPHAGHEMPAPTASPAVPATDAHAGHMMPAEQAGPHAGRAMPVSTPPTGPEAPPATPHAGHAMTAPESQMPSMDPHAGHAMPSVEAGVPHAGHDMTRSAEPAAPPVAPPPPEALSGPANAADAVFGAEPMAAAREELRDTHGDLRTYKVFADELEVRLQDGSDGYAWEDVGFRYGGDIDRLWVKSEGEGTFGGSLESGDVQALWSHAVDPWFEVQAGLRLNFGEGPERPHLVLGVQGLAPYRFEVDAAAFLSAQGDVTGRIEVEYDQRITERLILQPRVEAELSAQDVPELRIGSGLLRSEAGLRLRYEIAREFAPYVGVQYEHAFGDTADFQRAAGDDAGGWSLVAGVRIWF